MLQSLPPTVLPLHQTVKLFTLTSWLVLTVSIQENGGLAEGLFFGLNSKS